MNISRITAFSSRYKTLLTSDANGIFMFDNAHSHRKVADHVLNADKMNVGPGL